MKECMGDISNDVVTLSEIESWVLKQKQGEPLPINWKYKLNNYILSKDKFANIHRERLRFCEDCLDKAKNDWLLLTGEEYDSE